MFTAEELKDIDAGYFSVIASGGFTLTLQSKNTGHCWHILLQEYPHFRSCLIYHTHRKGTAGGKNLKRNSQPNPHPFANSKKPWIGISKHFPL